MSFLGIICGLLAMLGFGLDSAIAQAAIKKIGNVKTLFFREIFIIPLLLIPTLIFTTAENISWFYIVITLLIGATIGYIPIFAFYKALKTAKLGLVTPIANSAVVFTTLFSIIFYAEDITRLQLFAIGIIVVGIFLLSIDFKHLKQKQFFQLSSGIVLALITSFFWGVVFAYLKIPINIIGPLLTAFVIESGVLIASGIHLKAKKESFAWPSKKVLKYIIGAAICLTIAAIASNVGVKITQQVGLIMAFKSTNPIVAALYGKFVYKDKLKPQQWAAILMIVVSIILISL